MTRAATPSLEQLIHSAMSQSPAVGSIAGTRIFPQVVREGSGPLPAVVYARVSTVPLADLDGDDGLDSVRLRISAWATDYATAKALASAVRVAIRENGQLKARTVSVIDSYDNATRRHCVMTDINVWSRAA